MLALACSSRVCRALPFNMTPTRTDTTLQQRRRAFNHISLNNSRSHVHSFDTTRSKAPRAACSTAAARVNNEQEGSNNMGGGHTREQLTSWVMSKDAVASCFIKDVLSMSESDHAGGTHSPARLFLAYPNSAKRQVFPITFSDVYPADQFPWLPS
jgi:hypothetical protein